MKTKREIYDKLIWLQEQLQVTDQLGNTQIQYHVLKGQIDMLQWVILK